MPLTTDFLLTLPNTSWWYGNSNLPPSKKTYVSLEFIDTEIDLYLQKPYETYHMESSFIVHSRNINYSLPPEIDLESFWEPPPHLGILINCPYENWYVDDFLDRFSRDDLVPHAWEDIDHPGNWFYNSSAAFRIAEFLNREIPLSSQIACDMLVNPSHYTCVGFYDFVDNQIHGYDHFCISHWTACNEEWCTFDAVKRKDISWYTFEAELGNFFGFSLRFLK